MASGWHGGMPASIFKDLILKSNPTDMSLKFEVSRMNNYRSAGLYRDNEFIMGVNLNEFPEYTVRDKEGGIEAIGWRDALTTLIREGWIKPTTELRTWLGDDGVAFALKGRGGEYIVRDEHLAGWHPEDRILGGVEK